MTKERGEDLILVAIVVSIAIHVALMFGIRARVMTHVANDAHRGRHREAMRVGDYQPATDPASIERIKDILSVRDAPAAEATDVLAPVTEQLPDNAAQHWDGDVPVPEAPPADSAPRPVETFAVTPIEISPASSVESLPKMEFAAPASRTLTAPGSAPSEGYSAPILFGAPEASVQVAAPVFGREIETRMGSGENAATAKKDSSFVPSEEVFEKVDEKIVEQEKAAVRELMDVADAEPLDKFVNVTAQRADDAGWTYFKLLVTPRATLPVVPKDVVILLDASGSIGSERLVSCRTAAKNILRTAFNTGDRFNLVAFRNSFSYAFRRWQTCSKPSFDEADRWLANLAAHGRTDVFGTISSVLTLPRDPTRPLIALVVTDGDANAGVSDTAQILSKFSALNDGLVSVYMYGVKASANRELIDVLTHGNRGESFIYGGLRWKAGSGIESLSERFRDPVLSDLRVIFTADAQATAYPRLMKNLYRGDAITLVGRVPKGRTEIAFSLKGLNGSKTYEDFFRVPLGSVAVDATLPSAFEEEHAIDAKLQ